MQSAEVKACLLQMQTLWTSYKAPQTEQELQLAVGTWLQFFGNTPFAEVSRTINEIAAEGNEFAPQIGQIYARVKAKRVEQIKGVSEIEAAYRNNARVLAKVLDIEPPSGSIDDIKAWFNKVKSRRE